jgi:hypothetical protein
MPRYPDFVCIGAQKAGTTWLHRCLTKHPQVFPGKIKEVHYFDSLHMKQYADFNAKRFRKAHLKLEKAKKKTKKKEGRASRREWLAQQRGATIDDAWYASLFADAAAGQLCGDITPSYSLLPPEGIAHLLKLSPNVKVLFLVRDPIERAFSQIRMTIKRKKLEPREKRLLKLAEKAGNRKRSDYPAIIDRWRSVVPAERFKVMFYDDIAERPQEFLREACQFLGIEYAESRFPKAEEKVYEGKKIAMPEAVRKLLVDTHAETLREMAKRYPERAGAWLQRQGIAPR